MIFLFLLPIELFCHSPAFIPFSDTRNLYFLISLHFLTLSPSQPFSGLPNAQANVALWPRYVRCMFPQGCDSGDTFCRSASATPPRPCKPVHYFFFFDLTNSIYIFAPPRFGARVFYSYCDILDILGWFISITNAISSLVSQTPLIFLFCLSRMMNT